MVSLFEVKAKVESLLFVFNRFGFDGAVRFGLIAPEEMMPYSAEINRSNPSCFLFLIDQSGSMQDILDPTDEEELETPHEIDGRIYTHTANGKTKSEEVADAINRLIKNIVIKCTKSDGVRDYYEIGVIGYGGDDLGTHVGSALQGDLEGRELVPLSEIADHPARIENREKKISDGAGGIVTKTIRFPIWLDPVHEGGTPMSEAMKRANSILSNWVDEHSDSFPPIVINITDGEWTGEDPRDAAEDLKSLRTSDGNVLLFNIHISDDTRDGEKNQKIEFPHDPATLPNDYAKALFNLSSPLPNYMQSIARQEGLRISEYSRGFAFNADMVSLVRFIDIGTRPINLR